MSVRTYRFGPVDITDARRSATGPWQAVRVGYFGAARRERPCGHQHRSAQALKTCAVRLAKGLTAGEHDQRVVLRDVTQESSK